ncbi:GH25 family lysozyme [Sphingomonas sp. RB3P16]|uniref:glycoside hydrolase family 25 protein n=1 Tax=Parasphingomonas frigoris TaxID=3096163 RepID=UPI002FC7461D
MLKFRLWGIRIGLFATIAATFALLGVVGWTVARQWRPSDRFPFQGLDVSARDGEIDWWAVKRGGADFAYVRATSGDQRDPRFEANWRAVAETGMRRGATHRYSLCRLAADQANAFNTTVPRTDEALPAALELDFDDGCTARPGPGIVRDELRRYITMVEGHTGKPLLLKVSKRFDAAYGVTLAIARPVWAMQNFFPPDYPARRWRMWQASDMRRIDGVDGPVHWDVVAP